MAGYFLSTLDRAKFEQLITNPSDEQATLLAEAFLEELEDFLEDVEEESDRELWPTDEEGLAAFIKKRLAMPDWYSDLSLDNALVWDRLHDLFFDEPGEEIGLDPQMSDYESIYWDCAEIAAAQGASLMAEPKFGNSGFRYHGKPSDGGVYPMYSVFAGEELSELATQVKSVESHFATLEEGEDTPREMFFECLLPMVTGAVENDRVLWVQTDT
ncbi:MAG: hypothetical protein RH917_10390 [Lacipirellulaceae bacterium]